MNQPSQGVDRADIDPKSPEQAAQDVRALFSSAIVSTVVAVVLLWGSFALLG